MISKFILKNKNKINRFLIFFVSFVLIFIFFPKEQKFRYEYINGSPWQHENLFAPYKFAINKLPAEIQLEIDSISENAKIYFVYDEIIQNNQIKKLQSDFETEWTKLTRQDSIIRANNYNYNNTPLLNKADYQQFLQKITEFITDIYNRGVYDPSELSNYSTSDNYKLVFNKDNFIKTYMKDQVFTLKTAYEYMKHNLSEELKKTDNELLIEFFNELRVENYIMQDLFFDIEKTEEIKRLSIENISTTRGVVLAGELIISRGEIITLEKFRILESLKSDYEQSAGKNNILLIQFGNALVIFVFLMMLILFIFNNKRHIYNDIPSFLMIFILLVFFVGTYSIVVKYNLFNVYILPLALFPLTIKIFFDERVALYLHLIIITLLGFIVPNGFEFVIIQFIGGYATIFGLTHLSRRGQLYFSAASSFIAMSVIYFAIAMLQEGTIAKINEVYFLYFALYSLLLMLAYPLIYALERIFGFISDITLLELTNTNHELLQKLASSAPGTFQHSIQVASLAEAAANKIGANSLLTKVGALYHDVGKISSPSFFIENQLSGFNPHDQIEFDQSAKIIIDHVALGIKMAKKSGLPQQIIDFIRTHHGTTTVQYFYKNYIKKYPEKADDVENFTYPGPRPYSKETVILMMADSIEAASRSMKKVNKENISILVDGIINYQLNAKQYEETNITFKDISELKELFKEKITNIYHTRIEYPK